MPADGRRTGRAAADPLGLRLVPAGHPQRRRLPPLAEGVNLRQPATAAPSLPPTAATTPGRRCTVAGCRS
ncbi:hypothetical protein OF001_U120109 [Pseudomonas sp. OF001]|nr:hypothetical protein OF001_U120109 [Pseudomonas sp. OF001]